VPSVPSQTQPDETDAQLPSRRKVLAVGAVVSVAGVAALAGCSTSSSPAASAGGTPAATGLAKLSDVPVGGSASASNPGPDGKAAVVAQPTAGNVVAFSAICTHMGCTVAPAGNQYHCPCHGSVYDAFTGKVISGPAPAALTSIPVKVDGGEVVVSS
jgi:cytochrome b6-f complex iron-sulfur subunit